MLFRSGAARPYRKHLLARARHVIAPSADSLALAGQALGGFTAGTRIRVAYNGMDVDRIVREASEPSPLADLPPDRPCIGMVGNLDWRKNPRCLVEATPAIRAAVPDVLVLLVGTFPDAESERRLHDRIVELGLSDVVRTTGFLSNPFPVVRQIGRASCRERV